MNCIRKGLNKVSVRLICGRQEVLAKLKERTGVSEFVATLILIVLCVTAGGLLIALFTGTLETIWTSVQSKIQDLFNYK